MHAVSMMDPAGLKFGFTVPMAKLGETLARSTAEYGPLAGFAGEQLVQQAPGSAVDSGKIAWQNRQQQPAASADTNTPAENGGLTSSSSSSSAAPTDVFNPQASTSPAQETPVANSTASPAQPSSPPKLEWNPFAKEEFGTNFNTVSPDTLGSDLSLAAHYNEAMAQCKPPEAPW